MILGSTILKSDPDHKIINTNTFEVNQKMTNTNAKRFEDYTETEEIREETLTQIDMLTKAGLYAFQTKGYRHHVSAKTYLSWLNNGIVKTIAMFKWRRCVIEVQKVGDFIEPLIYSSQQRGLCFFTNLSEEEAINNLSQHFKRLNN